MRGRERVFRRALGATLMALVAAAPLFAQTNFAGFTGSVTSQDGNPLPGVEVVATNLATGVTHMAKSNDVGRYTISALPIGTYKVRATITTFKPFETGAITLESGQIARVNVQMELGLQEAVTVTDVAPILQTENAVVGEVISENTIKAIPLNGRNFSQLSLLLPGVVTTAPDTFTEPKNFGQGRPYVNGQREQGNNFTLDGVDMNEVVDNLLPYQPSPDALAEVRVETNNYSAEFGNVAGAVIGSTIKSGSNEFHGTAFEYWRDSSMAANSWDNNRAGAKKADLSQHIFGASLGGPIKKNKLFFFADYQAFIRDRPGEQVVSVAPAEWRRGDFSGAGVDHQRSPHRRALPRQPDPHEPLQPRGPGGPGRPEPLPAAHPARRHQQPGGRLFRQDQDPPGRLQARRQPLGPRPGLRPRLAPEVQLLAGAPGPGKPAHGHQRLAVRGRGPQLDAHRQPEQHERGAPGLHQGEVPDHPVGLGGHRRLQRQHRHPRRPGHPRPEQFQHRQRGLRRRRHLRVQRHQDLPAHREVLLVQGPA